ncbi:MAG: methionine ABC transporter ATP-binding protein [Agrococcus casei]|uniref:methionine ABC transporter ATP-binding protein n=1 Tax=Agrococcus casei TaxID=343512 RepID=UPI003F919FF2
MTAHISIREVSKTYPPAKRGGSAVEAVRNVSVDVAKGEILGVVGYSGAGKSTLVRLINALEPVSSGSIEIDGVDITSLKSRQQREMRRGIGMIFQRFNLLRSRTVAGNVSYALEVAGTPKAQRAARVKELLDFVGLGDKADNHPEQLSGGQQQRVGIARALAAEPGILLADEATSALDPETTDEVLSLLQRVNRELGITIVLITHEMEVIAKIADRVVVMERGGIVEAGETYDVFTNPQSPVTKRFVATVVRALPSGDDLARLREAHGGRFFTIEFSDDSASEARVFRALNREGAEFQLIHGGIDDIRGRIYGRLLIAVHGDDDAIARAFAAVAKTIRITEVE